MATDRPRVVLFARQADDADTIAVADVLRMETVGGALMLAAAVVAVLWANLGPSQLPGGAAPAAGAARPGALGRRRAAGDLLLRGRPGAQARADRRRPEQAGRSPGAHRRGPVRHGRPRPDLRRRSTSRCPTVGRRGGPSRWPPTSPSPWPSSASSGSKLPTALRAFLLTLAIVDDLGSITVIAIFFSHGFSILWFLGALGVRGAVGAAAVATDLRLVPLSAAGRALLVVHVQQRHPRHRRRRAARSADRPRR